MIGQASPLAQASFSTPCPRCGMAQKKDFAWPLPARLDLKCQSCGCEFTVGQQRIGETVAMMLGLAIPPAILELLIRKKFITAAEAGAVIAAIAEDLCGMAKEGPILDVANIVARDLWKQAASLKERMNGR